MRPSRIALAVLCPLAFLGGGVATVAAATDVPPPSTRTLVGVMVDSRDGRTESTINCLGQGTHRTVNGDGTLFMPNLRPTTLVCFVTIRPRPT